MSKKFAGERDNATAYPQDSLLTNLPVETAPMPPEPITFHPPVRVEKHIIIQASEDSREWDRIDAQGRTTDETTRIQVGQTMLSGSDIEKAEVKKIVKKANLAKSRPKKDRRHLSPRGKIIADQAPPDIVRELRGE